MARDHPHNRRRREHIGGAGHEQRPNPKGRQLFRRHDMHQLLPGAPAGLGFVVELGPFRDAVGVDRAIGRAELAMPARQIVPLYEFDPGGGLGDVAFCSRKVVTGYREAKQTLRMGQRVVGSDAAAGGRAH